MKNKFVSWRRVSTKKQNSSGLGLAAQKEIIKYFIEREQGVWIADYEECYTGTDLNGCVELKKAIKFAKENDAVLIIAKTDRFRNCQEALSILDEMGEGNIEFCDLPHSDRFTLTLFWALAEREALITSIRTKQALAAKKALGEKTGGASSAWIESYKKKTKEQKEKESMERGRTKNQRNIESKDVQVFIKVLRNVFPLATSAENPNDWDWSSVTTKDGYRQKVLGMMRDYRDIDPTLFAKWVFDDLGGRGLQIKLASYMQRVKKAFMCNK